MFRKLILPSIPRSLTFEASSNGTEMKLKNLIETMSGGFMADAVGVSFESDWTSELTAVNLAVTCKIRKSYWCQKEWIWNSMTWGSMVSDGDCLICNFEGVEILGRICVLSHEIWQDTKVLGGKVREC